MTRTKAMRDAVRECGPCLFFPAGLGRLGMMATVLVMDLARECLRVRNGNMVATYATMRELSPNCWDSECQFRAALRECIAAGVVAKTSAPPGKPHTYRLTFFELGVPRSPRHSLYAIPGWKPKQTAPREIHVNG